VFSNFSGKDDLFLAVLEEHNRRRQADQAEGMRSGRTLARGLETAGRRLADALTQDPGWIPLLVEFWTHASRNPEVRARASAAHEELLEGYALVITELAEHDGLEFVIPAKEVARTAASLARGLTLERLLDPSAVSDARFEELFRSCVLSFTRPRVRTPAPRRR
jgi:AcrR family transcriptional regulator